MNEKKWKRKLPYRIYDYNYKVGESYYQPQTEYIDSRDNLRNKVVPPDCASYAERFAAKPIYGSAYGLPYQEHESALAQQLVHRRPSSASRHDVRDHDRDNVPSSSRLGREQERAPRDRKFSFNLGEDEQDKPRRKFSLVDDLDFKVPVSRYVDSDFGFRSSLDRDNLVSDDSMGIPSAMKDSIQRDIKKLEKRFKKADTLERGTGGPRSQQWHEVAYNDRDDKPTRKSSVKCDNVSYRDPATGATVRKASYQETSRRESASKPPRAPPKPSRLLSIEDSDFKALPRPRRRHLSLSDGDNIDFKLSSRSTRAGGDDNIERKFSNSKKVFDNRRAIESEELSNNINKMINKMRKHSLTGDEPSYSSRFLRASSMDPDSYGSTTRRQSKSSLYSYGYSK